MFLLLLVVAIVEDDLFLFGEDQRRILTGH